MKRKNKKIFKSVHQIGIVTNNARKTGHAGLKELILIREIADSQGISLNYEGRRPQLSEIKRESEYASLKNPV